MPAIVLRDLRARRPHHIGHRTLAEGEVLCRMQFRTADDAKFFGNHLRWSAFEMVDPEVKETEPTPAPAPAPAPVEPTPAPAPAPAAVEPAAPAQPVAADPAPQQDPKPSKPSKSKH